MFVSVGYGNMVNVEKILGISAYNTAPIKRRVASAKKNNICIDMTMGRTTSAVIFMQDNYIILSANSIETIAKKIEKKANLL